MFKSKRLSLIMTLLAVIFIMVGCAGRGDKQTALSWKDVNTPEDVNYEYTVSKLPNNRLSIDVVVDNKVNGAQMEAIAKKSYTKKQKKIKTCTARMYLSLTLNIR